MRLWAKRVVEGKGVGLSRRETKLFRTENDDDDEEDKDEEEEKVRSKKE